MHRVDLNAHINQTVEKGSPAEFPIALRPLYHDTGGTCLIAHVEPTKRSAIQTREARRFPQAHTGFTLVPRRRNTYVHKDTPRRQGASVGY